MHYMKNRKSKGSNAERELIHKFWKYGWAAIRAAGSGSQKYPSPDILAGNVLRRLAIECKAVAASSHYFPKEEINALKSFSQIFNAEPWVAIRFQREGWYFISLDDLKETGKAHAISLQQAKKIGFSFEDLVKQG